MTDILTGADGAGAERLQARLRWPKLARESPGGAVRVALLSTFTIDPLVPYLGTGLADAGIHADLWVAPLNQIERQCLEEESLTAQFAPEIVVAVPRFEELWAGRGLPLNDADGYEADLCYGADACARAAERWNAQLLFVLPPVPEIRPTGVGDDGNATGVFAAAARARELVRGRLAGREGVSIVDAEAVLRSIGSRHAYRPALLATAQIPYSEEYFHLLGQRISRLVTLRRHRGSPLIVLDATALAGDRPGQPTATAAKQAGQAPGSPATSLIAYLAEMIRAGTAVALCNATGISRARFEADLPIAAWHGPGPACAEQIRDLAGRLSAGWEQVTFLSTQKSSVADVVRELPQVTTLELPLDPEYWPHLLNDSAGADQLPPQGTNRAASHGASGADGTLTLETFLENLRLNVVCTPMSASMHEAAADLTRRVAEFHLDGDIWPAERFACPGPAQVSWGITVSDRFGDHGFCGVVVAHADGATLAVDEWVLTCPVLGKGVEDRVLAQLAELALARGCTAISFRYRATPRNDAIRRFLDGLTAGSPAYPAAIQIPVERLHPRPARCGPAAAVPAAAQQGPKRRTGIRPPATGRLTTAAQLHQAVQTRGRRQGPSAGLDEGGQPLQPRTETERQLLAVFIEVLGHPGIGVNANFFSYGNSMLAVQLIAKANQAGLRLSLRQVFQYQTVAALAAVAATVPRRSDDAATVGTAPLLPLQAWFFGLELTHPGHFNQSQRFELPHDVDVDAMHRAVAALFSHHQSLRAHFVRTASGLQQIDPGPPTVAPFSRIDLSATSRAGWEEALAQHELEIHKAMSPADGRLAAFALFNFGPERPPQLLVVFHHLAIDGISWRLLLGDLQAAYHQALSGDKIVLSPVGTPVLAWAKRLNQYAQTDEVRAELPRWLARKQIRVEPLPQDVPGTPGCGVLTDSEMAVLSAEETSALRTRAVAADRVSLDVLLLAAAVRALARWTGSRRFLLDVVNHGRETFLDGADLSRTVGWLVLNVPVLFEAGEECELADLVPAINSQLRIWSSHHGAGDNLLRFLSEDESVRAQLDALPGAEILFSYGGGAASGPVDRPLLGRTVDGRVPDIDPRAATPYVLQFDAMIVNDWIRAEIGYRSAQYHGSTIRRLADDWVAGLRGLVGKAHARQLGREPTR